MDSISALTVFVQAAELRNFSSVARQLNLSASAIGKAISRLEDRHGVRLFNRSTRTVTLTQEGKFFLESCQRILSEFKKVEAEFQQTKCVPRGRLRISLPAVSNLLVSSIGDFMRQYPDIGLDLEFSDELVDVIEGGYDLVVRSGVAADSRLMTRRLGRYRHALVGTPAYLERSGFPSTPGDLAHHACIRLKAVNKIEPWPIRSAEASEVPESIVTSSYESQMALVQSDHGIACLPEFIVRRQIENGTLVSVLESDLPQEETFCALWPTSQYLSPRLRVFLDFLAKSHFPAMAALVHEDTRLKATPLDRMRLDCPVAKEHLLSAEEPVVSIGRHGPMITEKTTVARAPSDQSQH